MKIGMLFPGYGSQFIGMGKEIYDESRSVQEQFEQASHCLETNFIKLCFASSDLELSSMGNAYTSIFLISTSITNVLKHEGIVPDVVVGYGVGAYSALSAVGCFNFADGLYLLNKFAQSYSEFLSTDDYGVCIINNISAGKLAQLCQTLITRSEQLDIAVYLSETDYIVSGHASAIEKLIEEVRELKGIKIKKIKPETIIYSPLIKPVIDKYKMYLEKVDFNTISADFISTIDTRTLTSGPDLKRYITEYVQQPLQWHNALGKLADCDILIEVGPGTVLSGYARKIYPDKTIMSINSMADLVALKEKCVFG